MKPIQYIIIFMALSFCGCKKFLDRLPESNLSVVTYFKTIDEVQAGINGCYNGLQRPLQYEWQVTELRSDNTKMGVPGSTASGNRDLSDLDVFIPPSTHSGIYNYWVTTYNNIKNVNIILQSLGATYDPAAGSLTLSPTIDIPMSDSVRRQMVGELLFMRGYHYFNLVRLYGGVFVIHTPITPTEAKTINRSSVADIYKLVEADLKSASMFLSPLRYSQIIATNAGKANAWAAKAMLAKVYLTLNRKPEAITLLQDVITNSGFSLQSTYAAVFSTATELNSEILFTVRFKSGGLGLGSSFGNDFGPLGTGSSVINGSGLGNNYPTNDLDTAYLVTDARKAVSMATFGTGSAAKLYVKKFLTPVTISGDGESDWPIMRYADVLLMMAEAQGYNATSIGYINQVRARTGLGNLPATVNTVALFEQALSNERRLEFAFENQRWFDLLRFNTTLTTITAQQTIKNHFAKEYARHYAQYLAPTPTLAELQANVTDAHLILPIPQHEIDTNTQLTIAQNPGY